MWTCFLSLARDPRRPARPDSPLPSLVRQALSPASLARQRLRRHPGAARCARRRWWPRTAARVSLGPQSPARRAARAQGQAGVRVPAIQDWGPLGKRVTHLHCGQMFAPELWVTQWLGPDRPQVRRLQSPCDPRPGKATPGLQSLRPGKATPGLQSLRGTCLANA
ncbi:hypothetical protein NN561_011561 [Cricetulus griseus]